MNSHHVQDPPNDYPTWAPRFWHGMRPAVWWKLLSRNRYQISFRRWHIALGVSLVAPINEILCAAQQVLLGRKIRNAVIDPSPVFILGHWRSGTTFLHELLVSSAGFASPNTYQCFAPSHFLVSGSILTRFGGFLLPKKRPMDEMAAGWLLPQEDEFALMNLGLPSPYLRIAFPQTQEKYLEYLDFANLTEAQRQSWRAGLLQFIRSLSVAYPGRRLVLKSPTHTGRIAELYQMFPKARFIHLTRDPRKLFPSTMRLWRALDQVQSLHAGFNEDQLIEYVRDCMDRMYLGFHRGREMVPESQIMDVKYEELVADPKAILREVYQQMNLGDFDDVIADLDAKLVGHHQYRTNRHDLNQQWEHQIMSYCADYAARYGYT